MLPAVELKRIKKKGLGVFALKNYQPGEIIEICPVIFISAKERKKIDRTILAYYIYPWKSARTGVMVLGYGSIYNHAYKSNANWEQNFKTKCMVYKAYQPIKKGEEITVNYNGDPDNKELIDWFEVR